MSIYGLIEPFENDSPDFCLGVEWEMFRTRVEHSEATADEFKMQIHRDNAERLSRMCDRHDLFCEVRPCPIVDGFPENHFDEWREIFVGGMKANKQP